MKRHRLRFLSYGLFAVALLAWMAGAKKRSDATAGRIPVTAFIENQKTIVGLLGVPLGTVVEIEATIVAGSSLPGAMPNLARTFLLSVEKVNGVALPQPKTIWFTTSSAAELPASYEDLPSNKKRCPRSRRLNSKRHSPRKLARTLARGTGSPSMKPANSTAFPKKYPKPFCRGRAFCSDITRIWWC